MAQFDHARHSTNMIVVPMRRHDQPNVPSRVDANAFQIAQNSRPFITIKAGIDNDPPAIANMQDDALAGAGARNC